jgi:hypothetical protein
MSYGSLHGQFKGHVDGPCVLRLCCLDSRSVCSQGWICVNDLIEGVCRTWCILLLVFAPSGFTHCCAR